MIFGDFWKILKQNRSKILTSAHDFWRFFADFGSQAFDRFFDQNPNTVFDFVGRFGAQAESLARPQNWVAQIADLNGDVDQKVGLFRTDDFWKNLKQKSLPQLMIFGDFSRILARRLLIDVLIKTPIQSSFSWVGLVPRPSRWPDRRIGSSKSQI